LTDSAANTPGDKYDLALVMPCYNECEVVAKTVADLQEAFARSAYRLQLVAVDNGSTDETGDILNRLREQYDNMVVHRVERNQGYGYGVLSGFAHADAPWVGSIVADGQVDADDVVKLFADAMKLSQRKLVKVRRRFRMDGLKRKIVSVIYNCMTTLMFGGLGSIDINGSPKIIPREYLERMNLQSKDWFLDAEIMIKAKRLGLGVYEKNIFAQLRPGGRSNVNSSACWEFIVNLLRYRFGRAGRTLAAGEPSHRVEAPACHGD